MKCVAAKAVLDEALASYRRSDWDVAYGSSGTIGAVADVLGAAGWAPGIVDRAGLAWLHERMLAARSADKLRLDGIKDDRLRSFILDSVQSETDSIEDLFARIRADREAATASASTPPARPGPVSVSTAARNALPSSIENNSNASEHCIAGAWA